MIRVLNGCAKNFTELKFFSILKEILPHDSVRYHTESREIGISCTKEV